MTQNDQQPSYIEVPPLEHQETFAIGRIVHVLAAGGRREIASRREVRVSARRVEVVYGLEDGTSVLVTSRSGAPRPNDVDGVLRRAQDGTLRWVSHRMFGEHGIGHVSGVDVFTDCAQRAASSWEGKFRFIAESIDTAGNLVSTGLRPPQLGGLHAIGSHWSLHRQPATVVMPTGTGKTETMLAMLAAYKTGRTLVVVPSRVLRDQTASKFATFGLLRSLGNLIIDAQNPVVGVLKARLRTEDDLSIFDRCNVVVTTMSAITGGTAAALLSAIADRIDTLVVDEAHHVAAQGWSEFRQAFVENSRVLQFTATPYRRDGKLVDGVVIYDYPLRQAQQDGYFRPITFQPVFEEDSAEADEAIAECAVDVLRSDLANGYDHLMMVRCASIERAEELVQRYQHLAPELQPTVIHSEAPDAAVRLRRLIQRESRIAVCVNMLGEGFDLPQLKVAAVHDTHKSLAVLLQFTGRFTRSAGAHIGNATVIANIADQNVSAALERLYSEDADWNYLLSELSSDAARAHAALVVFLNTSERLDRGDNGSAQKISHHLLRPKLSTLVYGATAFQPKRFVEGIPKSVDVRGVWLHDETKTLYFVTRVEPLVQWTRSKLLRDAKWDLHVLHFDEDRQLLFISSSDHDLLSEKLLTAVGAVRPIVGDTVFRCLGRINRLVFQNVGVRKHGRRNLSYAMYTGADVAFALSIAERHGSVKSNLSGTGWEGGVMVSIGCSYKGRIWTRDQGTILEYVQWCKSIGAKLQDTTIDTSQIISNVLVPTEVSSIPDLLVVAIEWPFEILKQSEERVVLARGEHEDPLLMFELAPIVTDIAASAIEFGIKLAGVAGFWATFRMTVNEVDGFKVVATVGGDAEIRVGSLRSLVVDYFNSYPPLIRFVDLSELDGNLHIRAESTREIQLSAESFEVWDWDGVDVAKESIWKDGAIREDSIQWKAAQYFLDSDFDVVFDDDSSGEAADLVCLVEHSEYIGLALVHCKFSGGGVSGGRVSDVMEVCAQAIRSAKWKWKFKDLCHHLAEREKRLLRLESARGTRFLKGRASDVGRIARASKLKEVRPEILIVQPGISGNAYSDEQKAVLAAASSYLKETIGVDLKIICGA